MSLDIARLIAFSGISATELQISVASSNISNADTAGYTVKTANQSASYTAGVGTGVSITGITSTVDQLLLKSLVGATSDLGSADTTNSYMSQLAQLFGSATSSGHVDHGYLAGQLACIARNGGVGPREQSEQRVLAGGCCHRSGQRRKSAPRYIQRHSDAARQRR